MHVVHLEPAPREKCEEVSEVSPHTICTQEKAADSETGVGECVVRTLIFTQVPNNLNCV